MPCCGLMRKPPFAMFERLNADFQRICRREGLSYQLIPYFISSHPMYGTRDAGAFGEGLGAFALHVGAGADLTPTPMTLSSVMFRTGGESPIPANRSMWPVRRRKAPTKSYFFSERPAKAGAAFGLPVRCVRAVHRIPVKRRF